MEDSKSKYKICARCGRKYKPRNGSIYCGIKCRTTTNEAKQLSVKLIKEIYGLVSNEGLFSDLAIGERLRGKDMKVKFDKILFIENKGDKDDNENK